jgi:hypothetical protein
MNAGDNADAALFTKLGLRAASSVSAEGNVQ